MKEFSASDFAYGREAEIYVRNWLRRIGYSASCSLDPYAPDVTFQPIDGSEPPWRIEVERRYRWDTDRFPFADYNLPERRWCKMKSSLLFVVNAPITRALIVYRSSCLEAWRSGEIVVECNRHVMNERILKVPKKLCRLFDLEDFTRRSVDRMKAGELF